MKLEKLKLISGKHTIDSLAESLNLTKNSTYNLISKLQKQGYASKTGGGRIKAIYTITPLKKSQNNKGMFDILNKNSKIKVHPPFIHHASGKYSIENAIVDLIQLKDQRICLSLLYLFNKVKDWKLLYDYSKKKNLWIETSALYELARIFLKVRKIPGKYRNLYKTNKTKQYLIYPLKSSNSIIKEIEDKFNLYLPFNKEDIK